MPDETFSPNLLRGENAIVTGGASGIGLATVERMLGLGANVSFCGRSLARLAHANERLAPFRDQIFWATCDIRQPEQIASFVSQARARFGPTSILVNNAGGQFPSPARDMTVKGFDAVIRNNLNGTFYVTREVATEHMIPNQKGRIVNVTANIARGFPGMSHTGAARAGVENLTKSLAIEWAEYNIQINSVAPGIIATEALAQYPKEIAADSLARTPMRRFGEADEVASLIVFLSSRAANFVTGEVWYIDGGAHLWGETWPIPKRNLDSQEGILPP